jgi:hypothetical protein
VHDRSLASAARAVGVACRRPVCSQEDLEKAVAGQIQVLRFGHGRTLDRLDALSFDDGSQFHRHDVCHGQLLEA